MISIPKDIFEAYRERQLFLGITFDFGAAQVLELEMRELEDKFNAWLNNAEGRPAEEMSTDRLEALELEFGTWLWNAFGGPLHLYLATPVTTHLAKAMLKKAQALAALPKAT